MRNVLLFALMLVAAPALAQEKERFSGSNLDTRTTLAFKVSDAAVQKLLPEGWELNAPTAGPVKGMNLAVVLVDSLMAHDAEGNALAPLRGVILTIPGKKKGSDATGPMIFAGLAAASASPGAYGVYAPAQVLVERKSRAETDGKTVVEELWDFKGENGNAVEAIVHYVRGTPAKGKMEVKAFAAAKPDFYRIYRYEHATDVARSTALGIDRVSKLVFKASGPQLARLFDGSEQLIGVISVPWYSRQIYLPGSGM